MIGALSFFAGVVAFGIGIVLVVLIHEAAHFLVAKRFDIKVEEFFVGFGPRVWSVRRGETEYGVKALPLGGYVRIAGMNPFQEPAKRDRPRTFGAKPIRQRALVILAGPATHFVVAFVFFALYLGLAGVPRIPYLTLVVPRLNGHVTPAAAARLQKGDRILGIGPIADPTAIQMTTYTQAHPHAHIAFKIQRGSRVFTTRITPVITHVGTQNIARIGVMLGQIPVRYGPIASLTGAARAVGDTVVKVVQSFGRLFGPQGIGRIGELLFGNAKRQPTDATSVIGAGRLAGEATASGNWGLVLYLFGSLNVFIGILNLLPLLPFDGGHLAVLAVEKIRGRAIDARKLVPLTAVVATFLLLFMMSLVYLDITKPLPNLFH